MSAAEKIEKAALALSLEQRVHLAELLLSSIPAPAEVWSEKDEAAEVERRELQIKHGEVQPLPEAEFWNRIESRRKR